MTKEDLLATVWFQTLVEEVRQELLRRGEAQSDARPDWENECQELEAKIRGWSQSLAKSDLPPAVRSVLEADLDNALARKRELESCCAECANHQTRVEQLLDPEGVVKQLTRLKEVLGSNDATRTNLELSLYIDRIDCHCDGRVLLRICKLGALVGAVDLLATPDPGAEEADEIHSGIKQAKPRRRARLRTDPFASDQTELEADAHRAADPERFAGLAEHWFWEDVFQIPVRTCWAEDYAAAIAELRAKGKTHEQLAVLFGVTVPTIRKALTIAAKTDAAVSALPKKMPRARWQDLHFQEVAALRRQGCSLKDLCRHFGRSEPLIRAALRLAQETAQREGNPGAEEGGTSRPVNKGCGT